MKDNEPLREGDGWIFHGGLQTHIDRIQYDWHERFGHIWARGPVDMSGSIRLFTTIDAGVERICGYINGKPDVAYRRRGDVWEAGLIRAATSTPTKR